MSAFLLLAWLQAVDGGTPPARVSPEDAELLKNLELLESLDEASDFELLEELSVER
ncbi:MAG: hypothetical protein JNK82_26800 [Myxococcaceae bacterium]|nr:hypothetical protein [Myxococcaceae bacterium]